MNNSFGDAIKLIRKRNKLSMEELGNILNITKTGVFYWESGRSIPSVEMLDLICSKFNVDYNFLFGNKIMKQRHLIPILGKVPCGEPLDAVEDIVGNIEIESDIDHKTLFGLIAKGDSMYPEIKDHDTLVVRYSPTIISGEIAVVKVNNEEATCKKVIVTSDGLTLLPLNTSYEPLHYTKRDIEILPVTIVGKVIEIRRKL